MAMNRKTPSIYTALLLKAWVCKLHSPGLRSRPHGDAVLLREREDACGGDHELGDIADEEPIAARLRGSREDAQRAWGHGSREGAQRAWGHGFSYI